MLAGSQTTLTQHCSPALSSEDSPRWQHPSERHWAKHSDGAPFSQTKLLIFWFHFFPCGLNFSCITFHVAWATDHGQPVLTAGSSALFPHIHTASLPWLSPHVHSQTHPWRQDTGLLSRLRCVHLFERSGVSLTDRPTRTPWSRGVENQSGKPELRGMRSSRWW